MIAKKYQTFQEKKMKDQTLLKRKRKNQKEKFKLFFLGRQYC